MVCRNCGNNLDENMNECPLCGTKVEREVNNMNEENNNNVETLNNDFNQPMDNNINNNNMDMNNNMNNDMNNNMNSMDMNNNFNQPMNDMNSMNNMGNMNNNFNQPMNNMQPKKNNTGFIIIVAILVVIIATLGGILFMTLNKDNSNSNTSTNDNNSTVEQTSTEETFTNGGLTFKKVDGYYYTDAGEGLTKIMDEAGTFYAEIGVGAYPYDKVKESKDAVKEELAKQVTVTGADVKTIGSREYVLFSVEKDGMGAILGYTKLDDTHTIAVALASTDDLTTAFTKLGKLLDGIKLADGTDGESSFAITTIPTKDKSKSFTKSLK